MKVKKPIDDVRINGTGIGRVCKNAIAGPVGNRTWGRVSTWKYRIRLTPQRKPSLVKRIQGSIVIKKPSGRRHYQPLSAAGQILTPTSRSSMPKPSARRGAAL